VSAKNFYLKSQNFDSAQQISTQIHKVLTPQNKFYLYANSIPTHNFSPPYPRKNLFLLTKISIFSTLSPTNPYSCYPTASNSMECDGKGFDPGRPDVIPACRTVNLVPTKSWSFAQLVAFPAMPRN
jgi:hypothetical protein